MNVVRMKSIFLCIATSSRKLWYLFHLLGKLGFCFRIPAATHAIAFSHHLGGIADYKDVFAFGGKIAGDLAATGYDRSIGKDGSLTEGATIADEDVITDSSG